MKKLFKLALYAFGAFFALSVVVGVFVGDSEESASPEPVTSNVEQPALEEPKEETKPEPEKVVAEVVKEEPKEEKPSLSLAQQNVLRQAEGYLDYTAFSKVGLVNQLEYEGYSKEDATFAVNNISVDWNEQAGKQAESYLEYSSFSKQGLLDQLLYEGYTKEQADYGVKHVGY